MTQGSLQRVRKLDEERRLLAAELAAIHEKYKSLNVEISSLIADLMLSGITIVQISEATGIPRHIAYAAHSEFYKNASKALQSVNALADDQRNLTLDRWFSFTAEDGFFVARAGRRGDDEDGPKTKMGMPEQDILGSPS